MNCERFALAANNTTVRKKEKRANLSVHTSVNIKKLKGCGSEALLFICELGLIKPKQNMNFKDCKEIN